MKRTGKRTVANARLTDEAARDLWRQAEGLYRKATRGACARLDTEVRERCAQAAEDVAVQAAVLTEDASALRARGPAVAAAMAFRNERAFCRIQRWRGSHGYNVNDHFARALAKRLGLKTSPTCPR